MVSWIICRLVVLAFGMLYPAYASYKAVKTKNIREYVRWMMYWIVFALFLSLETFTDIFISWFPFYYEIKMAFVLWLLSPYTKGASLLYRKFVHPSLSRHEKEIDTYIVQAKERSYETVLSFGKRGLNMAASAAVQAATKSQGALAGRLRSFSMQDLRAIPDTSATTYQDPLYLEDQVPQRRPPIGHLTLPEGPGEEEGRALGHGQLDSADSGPALPCALQGTRGRFEGTFSCASGLPASVPGSAPPGPCCWLRTRVDGARGHTQGCTHHVPKHSGPGVLFIAFLITFTRCGTRALTSPAHGPKSPFLHSCPSKYLTGLFPGLVCVSWLSVLCW
ncbi:receptor expression-enhancing protein 4 isoform X3 [Choloepus didactylus]|uniref:receptor expression-enhancing protein 4 isoform X3 n=1 Tax=Choloepus didactylus TaxID=27675 RepID=UPI00189DCCC6|nr:receptor expression-enhancing protein 4 isoform X3 [Choloepus didactylus]